MPNLKKSKQRPWLPKPKGKLYKTWQADGDNVLYRSKRWRTLRKQVLTQEPLCRECGKKGIIKEAVMVDHITQVRLGGSMWEMNNLQPLCLSCHARKSGKEAHIPKKY